MMPSKHKFADGEKILCFHGPLLYEAKTVKAEVKDKIVKYFVHYQGWNKSWDEWVPENRVLKFNEQNLAKQKELMGSHDKNKKNKSAKKKLEGKDCKEPGSPSTPTVLEKPKVKGKESIAATPLVNLEREKENADAKKKKVRVDPNVESEDSFTSKIEVKVKIPDELKPFLVDDWDLITRQKKLVRLPARLTVDSIIAEYVNFKSSTKGISPTKESALSEITNGIRDYFNGMLGSQLLYKFERAQYQEILQTSPEDTPMSSIYGSVHLLRLFVKLGTMLCFTDLDEKGIQMLLGHIQEFLKFLARSTSYFALSDYDNATPEYLRKTIN